MASQIVTYELDDSTRVSFEIDTPPGFRPAGADEIAGRVKEAIEPAVETAQAVMERVRRCSPDEVQLKFGIKVSGKMHWLVAKIATEGNFEVTLTWRAGDGDSPES